MNYHTLGEAALNYNVTLNQGVEHEIKRLIKILQDLIEKWFAFSISCCLQLAFLRKIRNGVGR